MLFYFKSICFKSFLSCDKKLISINQSVQYCEECYFISKLDVEFLFSKKNKIISLSSYKIAVKIISIKLKCKNRKFRYSKNNCIRTFGEYLYFYNLFFYYWRKFFYIYIKCTQEENISIYLYLIFVYKLYIIYYDHTAIPIYKNAVLM